MSTLASAQEFADFRGVTLDETDNAATLALQGASDLIRRYCGQTFDEVKDEDITLDGTGTGSLLLPQLPVTEVSYVAILKDEVETEVTDYTVDPAGILWRSSYWPLGRQNILVSYTHGYPTIPGDIRDACLSLATRIMAQNSGEVVTSEEEDVGTYRHVVAYSSTATNELLGSDRLTLDLYRYARVA